MITSLQSKLDPISHGPHVDTMVEKIKVLILRPSAQFVLRIGASRGNRLQVTRYIHSTLEERFSLFAIYCLTGLTPDKCRSFRDMGVDQQNYLGEL